MGFIDANDLIQKFEELKKDSTLRDVLYLNGVITVICNEPAVDAVPVVRCKDCKNYDSRFGEKGCNIFCDAIEDPYPTRPDDFCSYGDRKGG